MLKLTITPEAEVDLEKIYEYTFNTWGQIQAEKYQDELFLGIQQILFNVGIGEIYSHAQLSYGKFSINKHLIFYRTQGKNCIVVRVLHERMNLKSHMTKK